MLETDKMNKMFVLVNSDLQQPLVSIRLTYRVWMCAHVCSYSVRKYNVYI